MTTQRRVPARTQNRFRPRLEILEDRTVPAQVNMTIPAAGGTLTINSANLVAATTEDLTFAPTPGSLIPGQIRITPAAGTTISLNGAAAVATPVDVSGVKAITANLGAGDDRIFAAFGSSIQLSGAMTLTMGSSSAGAGDDVDLGDIIIGGNLTVTMTTGIAASSNSVQFNTALIGGNVSVNFGSGLDKDTQFSVIGASVIGGSLSVTSTTTGAAALDQVFVNSGGARIGTTFTASLGAGNNDTDLTGVTIGGAATITGTGGAADTDTVLVDTTIIGGAFKATLGNGINDTTVTSSRIGGSLSVTGGAQDDTLTVSVGTSVGSFISALLGTGEVFAGGDTNIVSVDGTGGAISVGTSVTMTGTNASDSFTIDTAAIGTFVSASMGDDGGAGNIFQLLSSVVGTSVTATGTIGPDSVLIDSCTIGTSVSASLGSNANDFTLDNSTVGTTVAATGTTDIDTFGVVGGSTIGTNLTFTSGAGADILTVNSVSIGGVVSLNASGATLDNDNVSVIDSVLRKSLTVTLGGGTNVLDIDSNSTGTVGSTILGNLTVTAGTGVDVVTTGGDNPVFIGGTTSINMGANPVLVNDTITIDDTAFLGTVLLTFGSGNDTLNVDRTAGLAATVGTTFAEKLTVNMNAGNDNALFGVTADVDRFVLCRVASALNGGTGINNLTLKTLGQYRVNGTLILPVDPDTAIAQLLFANL